MGEDSKKKRRTKIGRRQYWINERKIGDFQVNFPKSFYRTDSLRKKEHKLGFPMWTEKTI